MVLGAVVLGGCGDAEPPLSETGYVLLDLAARDAGYRIDEVTDQALPVSVVDGESLALLGPDGREVLEPEAGELWYVHGEDAAVEKLRFVDEVALDEAFVVGSAEAAEQLAQRIGAEPVEVEEGTWQLRGRGAFPRLADEAVPAGLEELYPAAAQKLVEEEEAAAVANGIWAQAEVERWGAGAGLRGRSLDFVAASSQPWSQVAARAVSCADPVEGLWVTRRFDPMVGDWHQFTMEVRRDPQEPSKLVGKIRTHNWSGSEDQEAPGACGELATSSWGRRFDITVEMTAEGVFDGEQFGFWGTSWQEVAQRCAPDLGEFRHSAPNSRWYQYYLDRFTGSVAEDTRSIDALNNDGARSFDQPHLIQRVGCL